MSNHHFHPSRLSKISVLLVVISIISLSIFDAAIGTQYDLTSKSNISSYFKKILYSIFLFSSVVLQIMMVLYVRANIQIKMGSTIKLTFLKILPLASYFLIGIFGSILIYQLFFLGYYSTLNLSFIILVAYGTSSIFMGATSALLLSWYRRKHNYLILMYFISLTLILSYLILTSLVGHLYLTDRPQRSYEYLGGTMDLTGGKYEFLTELVKILAVASFLSIWTTTVILSYSSRRKLDSVRYLIMPSLLLIYFFFGYFFQDLFLPLFSNLSQSNPVLFSRILGIIFLLIKPIGGVMFGFAFWVVSKKLSYEKSMEKYLLFAGYGFLFLFSGNQLSSLISAPFPPFGTTIVTTLVMGSYLIMTGIYGSAILTSKNNELRTYVRNMAKESRFLEGIGIAELNKHVNTTVDKIVNKFGTSIDDQKIMQFDSAELKDYVSEIIGELRKSNKKAQDS